MSYIKAESFHSKRHTWTLSLRAEMIWLASSSQWLLTEGLSLGWLLIYRYISGEAQAADGKPSSMPSNQCEITSAPYFELHVNETCHGAVGNVTCHLHVYLLARLLAGFNKYTCISVWLELNLPEYERNEQCKQLKAWMIAVFRVFRIIHCFLLFEMIRVSYFHVTGF